MIAGEPTAIKCLIVILDQITDSTLGKGFGLIHHLFSLKSVRTKFQHKQILQAGHRFWYLRFLLCMCRIRIVCILSSLCPPPISITQELHFWLFLISRLRFAWLISNGLFGATCIEFCWWQMVFSLVVRFWYPKLTISGNVSFTLIDYLSDSNGELLGATWWTPIQ